VNRERDRHRQECHHPPKTWWEPIMIEHGKGQLRVSRRAALSGAAAALGSAAIATMASQATAQQKISQADATYQGTPKGGQHCDGCANFQAPNACKFVQGNVSPSGWCQLFTPKS
jgi:hypothetical protein